MTRPPDPLWQRPEQLLHRIAAELAHCQSMLHRLEVAIGPQMARSLTADDSRALQDIDRLSQTLADLATCLVVLGADIDGAPAIDARGMLAAMRLDDLAQRLGGRVATAAPADARVALF